MRSTAEVFSGAVLAVLLLGPSAAPAQAAEDWDFTPGEYGSLQGQGGDLELAGDSAWVPDKLKSNLLKTLKFALDPKRKPPVTAGVSVKDFYHGHIACPKPCPKATVTALSAFRKAQEAREGAALGGEWFDDVTRANLERYGQALNEGEEAAGRLLQSLLKDDCKVIYHTYEYSAPKGMKTNDKRRNIKTPIGPGPPAGFVPPKVSASSWTQNYCPILQFAFLVDQNGKVHVTLGSTRELSAVTGSPMN